VRSLSSGRLGPDRLLPATSFTTTDSNGAVQIRTHDHPSSYFPTKSVYTLLKETAERVPDRTALAVKRDGVWIKWTYEEYFENVQSVAKAFIKVGLKKSHGVGILGFNAPEWHISNMAAVVAGGLAAGIYTTNSSEAVTYVLEHSRANVIVVENEEQLAKVAPVWEDLGELKAIVQFTGKPSVPGVLTWEELLDIGRNVDDSVLQESLEKAACNQPAVLIYTSGTTGLPKGVMMSQDNLTWTVQAAQEVYQWRWDAEHAVSYLPLSHIAAQVVDIYLSAYGGATVWFADDQALQGSLIVTLKEVRPTRFFGVPRVYEKIQEKLLDLGKNNKGLKKSVMDWAKKSALEHHEEQMAGRPGNSLSYRIAKKLILSRIHAALGLDRATQNETGGFYSSAAPLAPHTFKYFQSLDIPVMELLGSSEAGGPQTASTVGTGTRFGSVGKSYPHFETKILNPDQNGVGEIVTRGRNVCLGYLWEEAKTNEVIDEDGWMHSGDLGKMDEDGFLYVCGRMKEILITGGGENVAPVPIEDTVKDELGNIVSQAMVVGDKRKHLAVILTLKTVLDSKNQPTDSLHPDVIEWLENLGSSAKTPKEVIDEEIDEVKEALMKSINIVNKKAISKAQKIHKYMIAPTDFSLAGGELTPTLKMKRFFITEKYDKEITRMFEHETQSSMW
jgi:long-chain-fatty-acid--CoA ligase ACSBG